MLTHSWWELARRVYLDTRFELDIDMDADGDSTPMEYINGGITSTASPAPGLLDQRAEWDSRIHRTHASLESHYYDFLLKVPDVGASDVYLGMIGVGTYELQIYGDRYELWNMSGPTNIGIMTVLGGTQGWHNIALRAGIDAGVWVNGAKIFNYVVGLYINEKGPPSRHTRPLRFR